MEMPRSIFWTVVINVLVNGVLGKLTSWNIHEFCSAEISRYDFAGEVRFDAEHIMKSENEEACSITVTPETLDKDEDNMVLFYFTTFELHNTCTEMNVTVRGGRRNKDKIIKGLPYHLCGINSTLTEEVYSTSGESLFIQVNWSRNSFLAGQLRGTFVLKFVTYHTGGCYNSDVHECSNGHCIPRMYNCSEDIKACGDVNDECEEITADETHVDFFSSIFRYILVFVAFVCIISLLKVMFKKGRRKCGDIAENLEGCLRGLGTRCRRCRNSNCSSKLRLPNFIRSCLRSSDSEMTDDSTNSRDIVTSESVINRAFSISDDQIHQINIHDSPSPLGPLDMTSPNIDPPSYEEVMASNSQTSPSMQIIERAQTNEDMASNTATLPPSHDENMLNTEEYISRSNNSFEQAFSDTDLAPVSEEQLSSNQITHSSLQPDSSSILNEYLSHFGIELSDGYSTDSDWDSNSNSSDTVSNQITETQSASNVNVIDSDWDADSNSSGAVLNQITETQSVSNMNVTDEADNPVSPPSYDDAVPPPYYYDYIANVSRYK